MTQDNRTNPQPSNDIDGQPLLPLTQAEETALRDALALDGAEMAFLLSASLPRALAARVLTTDARWSSREQLMGLLWITLPVALGYAGWLLAAPVLWGWAALARQTGATAILASTAAGAALGAADLYLSAVEIASTLPGFEAPLYALSTVAAIFLFTQLLLPGGRLDRFPVRQSLQAV